MREGSDGPLERSPISCDGIAIERQTGRGTNAEEQGTIAKVSLITVVFSNQASASIRKEALHEAPSGDSSIAIQGELIGSVIEHVTAKGKRPAGKAGCVDAEFVAGRGGSAFGCTREWGLAGFAGHFFELFRCGRRSIVTQFAQPIHVVIHHFHGTVGGQAKALIVEQGEHVLGEEAREEISLVFGGKTIHGVVDQFIHIKHGVCQLIGCHLVLIANNDIRDFRSIQQWQHLVEDLAITASVLSCHRDAVFVGRIEVRNDLCDCSFTGIASVLMPPNNFLRRNHVRPWIFFSGFSGRSFSWGFGRGFSFRRSLGGFFGGGRRRRSAGAQHQRGN